MHKILHIWYGTFLHLQRESIIFFLNRKAVICRSTLLLWVIDGYRLIYLTWNAKHFLPRPKVKSFFSVHKGTFWVLFVLLHILGKQGQAFVKMCVCVGISCILFPSACLKGTLDVSFPVLTIMGFNHIGRIFCTALMKGHTYWADLSIYFYLVILEYAVN